MHERFVRRLFLCVAIPLVFLGNCWVLLHNPLNSDVAWYLRLAHDLLGGKHLYQDYFDTNPPLSTLLQVPPVWLAATLGVPLRMVWIVFTTVLTLGFCAATARFWSLANQSRPGEAGVTFLFLSISTTVYLFGFDFGQRDPLVFTVSLALAMLLACRIRHAPVNTPFVCALSAVAGCFLAIKPFFLVPWILCLAYAAVSAGWRSVLRWPETWIATTFGFLQVPIILFGTPAYIRFLAPLSELYSRYDEKSLLYLVRQPLTLIPALGIAAILVYRPSENSVRTIRMAAVLTIGWILSGLLQRKGWPYQVRPGEAGLCFVLWLAALDFARRRVSAARGYRMALAGGAVALMCIAGVRFIHVRWKYPAYVSQLSRLLDHEVPGRVLMISTAMPPVALLDHPRFLLANRYVHLWPLPAFYTAQIAAGGTLWRYHTPAEMSPAEKDMLDRTSEDLAGKPGLVIVSGETEQGMGSLKVDLDSYFRQDPAIARQMDCYKSLPGISYYRVYRRLPNCGI